MYDKNPPENGGFVSNLKVAVKFTATFHVLSCTPVWTDFITYEIAQEVLNQLIS